MLHVGFLIFPPTIMKSNRKSNTRTRMKKWYQILTRLLSGGRRQEMLLSTLYIKLDKLGLLTYPGIMIPIEIFYQQACSFNQREITLFLLIFNLNLNLNFNIYNVHAITSLNFSGINGLLTAGYWLKRILEKHLLGVDILSQLYFLRH